MTDDEIERRLLELSYTTDHKLTVPALAYFAPCSMEDAQRVLDRLVTQERLRLEVDDNGNLNYELPDRERMHTALTHPKPMPLAIRHGTTANPGIAAALSLIIPGAGQLYAGRAGSAAVWFFVVMIGYLLILPGLFLHVLCVISAAATAHRLNDTPERLLLRDQGRSA